MVFAGSCISNNGLSWLCGFFGTPPLLSVCACLVCVQSAPFALGAQHVSCISVMMHVHVILILCDECGMHCLLRVRSWVTDPRCVCTWPPAVLRTALTVTSNICMAHTSVSALIFALHCAAGRCMQHAGGEVPPSARRFAARATRSSGVGCVSIGCSDSTALGGDVGERSVGTFSISVSSKATGL